MRARAAVAVVVAALVLGVLGVRAMTEDAAPGGASVPGGTAHGSAVAAGPAGPSLTSVAARPVLSRPPSIVLVLMDDFSLDLLDTMRSAERMRRTGATYEHAFVVDSLCCVSRSSTSPGSTPTRPAC